MTLSYKLFSVHGNLTVNAGLDPDVNAGLDPDIFSLDAQYFNIDDAKTFVNNNISSDSFSVLNLILSEWNENPQKLSL